MKIRKAPFWESPDGRITLYCGDCLRVMRAIEPGSVDMVCCDLPYGVTDARWDSIIPLDTLWTLYLHTGKSSLAVCLTATQPFTSFLVSNLLKWFKHEWIWEKSFGSNFGNVKYAPMKEHENVLVFGNGRITYNPQMIPRSEAGKNRRLKGSIKDSDTRCRTPTCVAYSGIKRGVPRNYDDPFLRYPRSIVKFANERGLHPNQKPVALMEHLIKTYSNENELVLDNCMGSGTTGVACLNTGRRFIGVEKDPVMFEKAVERIKAVK